MGVWIHNEVLGTKNNEIYNKLTFAHVVWNANPNKGENKTKSLDESYSDQNHGRFELITVCFELLA